MNIQLNETTALFPQQQTTSAQNGTYDNTAQIEEVISGREMPATRPTNCSVGQTWLWEPSLWNLEPFDDTQLGA